MPEALTTGLLGKQPPPPPGNLEVGGTKSKNMDVSRFQRGPPQIKILCVLVSKLKKLWDKAQNWSINIDLKI